MAKKDDQKKLLAVAAGLGAFFLLRRKSSAKGPKRDDDIKIPDKIKPSDDDDPTPGPRKTPGKVAPVQPLPDADDDSAERFDEIYSDSPRVGAFYQITSDDKSGLGVAKRALQLLGAEQGFNPLEPLATGTNQYRLLRIMSEDDGWNAFLYGARDANQRGFPESETGLNIARAWNPWHKNAVNLLRSGSKVMRTIKANGKKDPNQTGGAYGLVWIPDVRIGDDGLVYAALPYEDGTPATYPPPEFRAELSGIGIG